MSSVLSIYRDNATNMLENAIFQKRTAKVTLNYKASLFNFNSRQKEWENHIEGMSIIQSTGINFERKCCNQQW